MDITTILQAISSVGFPIVVALICFYYIYKLDQHHKDEVSELTTAINNNTVVMEKILTKLGLDQEG